MDEQELKHTYPDAYNKGWEANDPLINPSWPVVENPYLSGSDRAKAFNTGWNDHCDAREEGASKMRRQVNYRVRCLSVSEQTQKFGDANGNVACLVRGQAYNIVAEEVHRWHTLVWIEGIPGSFNKALFEQVHFAGSSMPRA